MNFTTGLDNMLTRKTFMSFWLTHSQHIGWYTQLIITGWFIQLIQMADLLS